MYVFIDNNIFISLGCKFNSGDLCEFKRYIINRHVQLIITPVSNAELRKHYEKTITQGILNKYKGLLKAFEEFSISYSCDLTDDDIESQLNRPLELFLNEPSNIHLDVSSLNIAKLIDDYHYDHLPFEPSKDDEFKDAINVQLLQAYQSTIEEPIYIISNDKGFNKALLNNDESRFKIYTSLNDFNVYLRGYEADYVAIGLAIERHFKIPEFNIEINKHLKNPEVYFTYNKHITIKEIIDVDFKNPRYAIMELTESECRGTIQLHGTALVKYINSLNQQLWGPDSNKSQDLLINGKIVFFTSVPFWIKYKRLLHDDIADNWIVNEFIIDWSSLKIEIDMDQLHALSIDLEGSMNLV